MIEETLVTLRKKKGMSQQEVAELLDVTRQTISNWESGLGAPTLDKANQLAQLYKVSLDDLVGNEVEFVCAKPKKVSRLLQTIIHKKCIIDGVDMNLSFDELDGMDKVRVLDVNEEWVKIEYERTKVNAIFKKETVSKYIDLSAINAFQMIEEEE